MHLTRSNDAEVGVLQAGRKYKTKNTNILLVFLIQLSSGNDNASSIIKIAKWHSATNTLTYKKMS